MHLFQPAAASVPTGPLTVAQIVGLYLGQNAAQYAPEAQRERTRVLELFCLEHGHKPVSACRPADLVFWMNAHPEWVSDWSKLRIIRTVNRPFNWAVSLGLLDRNPFKGVSHPAGCRGRPMQPQEFQQLLRATGTRKARLTGPAFRRVLIALHWSGMRPGELRSLRWEHLDLDKGCAVLTKHKTARTRRDRAPRVIILHPVVAKLMLWIRKRQLPGEAVVFLNFQGKPWSKTALDLRLYRMRHKLGIPEDCKLYGMRHAFATSAVIGGVDLSTLAQLLGHTSTAMSSYYVHLAGQTAHLQAALRKAFGK